MDDANEKRVQEKKRNSNRKRPLKKLVTNVFNTITKADKFEQLEFLAHNDSLKILCSNFDLNYSSLLSNYYMKGETNFELCLKIVDKSETHCLAHARLMRNGIKLYPGSPDTVHRSDFGSVETLFAMFIKPKFVSYAQDGCQKLGEMYSNLRAPVFGVKINEKSSFTVYSSTENNETPIMTVRGSTNIGKWMAKSVGASFSGTDFKVYLHQSSTLIPMANIYPNVDLNVFDTGDKCAKFLNIDYKSVTNNVSDRAAVLGLAILLCVHRCMKELHQIFESYQKSHA